jgi:hypothetical protein
MLQSAESRLRAMQVKINSLVSARNLNRINKYFRVFIRALHRKKDFLKIQEYIHEGANLKLYIPEFFNFELYIPEYSPI